MTLKPSKNRAKEMKKTIFIIDELKYLSDKPISIDEYLAKKTVHVSVPKVANEIFFARKKGRIKWFFILIGRTLGKTIRLLERSTKETARFATICKKLLRNLMRTSQPRSL